MLDPDIWLTLVTLTFLEIILGVDNIIFLSLVVAKLPAAQQNLARRMGLGGAMIMRILLLVSIAWLAHLTVPLFTLMNLLGMDSLSLLHEALPPDQRDNFYFIYYSFQKNYKKQCRMTGKV